MSDWQDSSLRFFFLLQRVLVGSIVILAKHRNYDEGGTTHSSQACLLILAQNSLIFAALGLGERENMGVCIDLPVGD